ncbi:hypothetical protein ACFSFW_19330 [Fredinandcohnia salidurans]|uniref:Uncharacterized protein n=1 Tax=Fredinandcohnia salidurans TaxID=2595041 RepID=A0ABW4MS47_9BACI
MNKKFIVSGIIFLVVIVGIFYITDRMKYTTFQEVILDEINQDEIKNIDISRKSGNEASVSLSDKDLVAEILKDFSDVKLKKVNENVVPNYTMFIYVDGYRYAVGINKTENLIDIVDGKKAGIYKIVSDTDYLETIENLDLDWE